jgi:hypothetical protein
MKTKIYLNSDILHEFSLLLNPIIRDFDLPNQKRLFWFFFDKERDFLSKFSTSKCVFEKICSTNFAK